MLSGTAPFCPLSGEIGRKILEGSTTLEELAKQAEEMGAPQMPSSGRQEYLQSIVNEILFK